MFDVNANFHYVIPVAAEKFNVYPLAGANIAFFNHDIPTRIGLNLGGGLEFFITDTVKIIGEAKYITTFLLDWVLTLVVVLSIMWQVT